MDSVNQDQTAQNVQSDLDLHCPQKFLVLSSVMTELIPFCVTWVIRPTDWMINNTATPASTIKTLYLFTTQQKIKHVCIESISRRRIKCKIGLFFCL